MSRMIPYGRQEVTELDIEQVIRVLRSDYLTQGPEVPRFERIVARYCGAKYAVAVNSATSALHIACLALEVGEEDIVWTSPTTFVASANCVRYCGANVDFVDIDRDTWNICPSKLSDKLREAKSCGKLPKVVIPVHLCGQPSAMEEIYRLKQEYGFHVIEDASHAIGAKYKNERVGSCKWSDITVFSFHPVKIITTGEGGLATTQNARLAERMQLFRTHGITKKPEQMQRVPPADWYYEQVELGYNYRMTDIQAALGSSQMERVNSIVQERNLIAGRYRELLQGLPLKVPQVLDNAYSSWHLFPVRLQLARLKKRRDAVFRQMREAGIGVNLHYMAVHLQPYYQKLGFKHGDFPEAEAYTDDAMSLPIYPTLSENQQQEVVHMLNECLSK
jgi:UDP-4-amino-4,6-dideoxy-N-acetyl-beta-L-altrosamine transaminase